MLIVQLWVCVAIVGLATAQTDDLYYDDDATVELPLFTTPIFTFTTYEHVNGDITGAADGNGIGWFMGTCMPLPPPPLNLNLTRRLPFFCHGKLVWIDLRESDHT
jgi:hypothetical protein